MVLVGHASLSRFGVREFSLLLKTKVKNEKPGRRVELKRLDSSKYFSFSRRSGVDYK